MRGALICGNAGVETTLTVEALPLAPGSRLHPGGMGLGVSGVGWNLASALTALGRRAHLCAFAGPDAAGALLREEALRAGMATHWAPCAATPQSLVLTDPAGEREVHADLKDTPGLSVPVEVFEAALAGCGLAFLTNVNWTRPLLLLARAAGVPVVTDLHAITDLENPYDADYLAAADLLYFSGARLGERAGAVAREAVRRFPARAVMVGLGSDGALLALQNGTLHHQPAFITRSVVSTVGAGDALAAAFAHFFFAGEAPRDALRLACAFASWSCGEPGGARGHPSEAQTRALAAQR